ncbi:MAG: adenylosuccinate synthase [Cyclobacteriaceae bacterium]
MKVDVLLGLQWGDEGKGKIVDFLAPNYNVVARFQGGPNAGHTLEFDGIKHVLHQIPSGIFRNNIKNIIGNGVVLDPVILRKEVEALRQYNLDAKKNLFVSKKTQLILPTHQLLDAAYEQAKGSNKIGSTLKGIGPTYQDKMGRLGIRIGDIISDNFESRYQTLVTRHKRILEYLNFKYELEPLEQEFFSSIEYLRGFTLSDTEYLVNDALGSGDAVLAEGAQGSLLDIDFGSYPFVTSSNTMVAGACTGLGVAPRNIGEVYGIFKAYCTRVGSGPFPTELEDKTGEMMREECREFGATTGRPRRCGWLDLPALKYAIMINGATQLFMMKADVLNIFPEIKVCTHYKLADRSTTDRLPHDLIQEDIVPQYQIFEGWHQGLEEVRDFESMPLQLVAYINFLETELDVPINIVSVGPDRTETIIRKQVMA